MKITLLGGNGFIGSHLLDVLVEAGLSVRVFDRNPEKYREPHPEVEYVWGDILDERGVASAVAGSEVVVHLVSTTTPRSSNADPVRDVRTNLVPALRMLEACVEHRVRKVVFLSSGGAIYGHPGATRIAEEHPTEPLSSYGIVKLAVEKYLRLFHRLHELDYAILRPSNPYGERQDFRGDLGFIAVALGRCAMGQPLTIWGDGTVRKDFFYVGDLAAACLRAVTRDARGAFNVGSGRCTSVEEVLRIIERVTGRSPIVCYAEPSRVDAPSTPLDIRRAREELEWEPRVDLQTGIERTWAWLREAAARDLLAV